MIKSSLYLNPEGLKCLPGKRPSSDFFACLSLWKAEQIFVRENYSVGGAISCSRKSPWHIRTQPYWQSCLILFVHLLAMSDVTYFGAVKEKQMGWRNITLGKKPTSFYGWKLCSNLPSSLHKWKEQSENQRKVPSVLSSVQITGCCFSKVFGCSFVSEGGVTLARAVKESVGALRKLLKPRCLLLSLITRRFGSAAGIGSEW